MRHHLALSPFAIGLTLLVLGGCADGDAGAGGSGGLEPCTEDTTCASSGDGGSGSGKGGDDDDASSTSTSTGDGGAPSGPTTTDASSSNDASTSTGDGGGTGTGGGGQGGGGGGAGEGVLVINEISASGDDWIELFNAGDADLDVSGLRVADDDGGEPNLADAIEIPDGTTLEPGDYLFVLADQDEASDGFVEACDPGPAPCLVAAFGITAGGDEIYVVDGDDEVVISVEYPEDATADGESWGRIPNGTGPFEVNDPTPGDANEAL